ncbi:MAG: hypothetical protein RLZZ447_1998 [Verrucomicrobiota bacterium]|jgi:hypothetical protein
MIFLGVDGRGALGGGVTSAEASVQVLGIDLSSWPRWALIAVATLLVTGGLWVAMKVLKWALGLLLVLVLLGGLAWAVWELIG